MLAELSFNLRHYSAITALYLLAATLLPLGLARLPSRPKGPYRPWKSALPLGLIGGTLGGLITAWLLTHRALELEAAYLINHAGEQRLTTIHRLKKKKGHDGCEIRVWALPSGARVGDLAPELKEDCGVLTHIDQWAWLKARRKLAALETENDPLLINLWTGRTVKHLSQLLGSPTAGSYRIRSASSGGILVQTQDGVERRIQPPELGKAPVKIHPILSAQPLQNKKFHRARQYGSCGCKDCPPMVLHSSTAFGEGQWKLSAGDWSSTVEDLIGANEPPKRVWSAGGRCLILGQKHRAVWVDLRQGKVDLLALE